MHWGSYWLGIATILAMSLLEVLGFVWLASRRERRFRRRPGANGR